MKIKQALGHNTQILQFFSTLLGGVKYLTAFQVGWWGPLNTSLAGVEDWDLG